MLHHFELSDRWNLHQTSLELLIELIQRLVQFAGSIPALAVVFDLTDGFKLLPVQFAGRITLLLELAEDRLCRLLLG